LLACLIVAPQRGYDEPAILSYAISSFCPTSADGLHRVFMGLGEQVDIRELNHSRVVRVREVDAVDDARDVGSVFPGCPSDAVLGKLLNGRARFLTI
jgi:hypothetical protein